MRLRRPPPRVAVVLVATAGAIAGMSQIVASFPGRPTPVQVIMTVLNGLMTLVASGVVGWMALPKQKKDTAQRNRRLTSPPTGGGAHKNEKAKIGSGAHKYLIVKTTRVALNKIQELLVPPPLMAPVV